MVFLLFSIAIILVILNWSLSSRLLQLRRAVIAASDLNLEAHQRLLAHFEEIERQKVRDAREERNSTVWRPDR